MIKLKGSTFIYRFTAAAAVVLICASVHYSGAFESKTEAFGAVLCENTDLAFLKEKLGVKKLRLPCGGTVTCPFSDEHTGVDIASENENEQIFAAGGGVVSFAGNAEGYGNCVKIEHGDGLVTLYGHMSEVHVSENDKVNKGCEIGIMGSTGDSTGRHLHFEVIKNGAYVDPKLVTKGL